MGTGRLSGIGDATIAIIQRFVVLLAAWLVLTEARTELLGIGILACALASLPAAWIRQGGGKRLRLWALAGYMPGFAWRSLEGGIDVARRVLGRSVRVSPVFVTHRCREEDETGRVLFCDAISLMPGTLATEIDGRRAVIHLLADEPGLRDVVAAEETRVQRLLGPTDTDGGGRHP